MANKEIKLLMENWRGFINEEQENVEVDQLAKDIASSFAQDLKSQAPAIKKQIDAQQQAAQKKSIEQGGIQEAAGLIVAGLVLAAPAILKIMGKIVDKIHGKNILGNENEYTKLADKLHHFYEKVFESALMAIPGFSVFPDLQRKKIVKVVMIGLTAYLAIQSGFGVAHAVKEANTVLVGTESALTALKTGEILQFLKIAFKAIAKESASAV